MSALGQKQTCAVRCLAYRGLIPVERVKHLNVEVNAQRWMGPGKHIVVYYVAAKRLLNFVGIVEKNTWTGVVDRSRRFEGCSHTSPELPCWKSLQAMKLLRCQADKSSWTIVPCPLWVKSGHVQRTRPCLLRAKSRHQRATK
jgi:hypothetical protein